MRNFGILAPTGIDMKPDVVFTRIIRGNGIATIEAYDSVRTVTVDFDLLGPIPPF